MHARLALVLTAVVIALTPLTARAQLKRLDLEIVQSVTLSPEQRAEVREWIDFYDDDAFGQSPAASGRAVEQLLLPFREVGVSVAFRQVVTEGLKDRIAAAIADDRVTVEDADGDETINAAPFSAMRLAGEIATGTTLEMLRGQLRNEDAGRRFFAIYGTEMVFYALGNSAPAVTPSALYDRNGDRASGLVPELGRMLRDEDSPRHAAAIIRALAEVASIRDEQFAEAARAALVEIGNGASARARAGQVGGDPTRDERLVWMTAGQSLFRAIAQGIGGTDRAPGLAALRLAGHLVASVYLDLDADRLPPVAERKGEKARLQLQMTQLAGNLLTFGEQTLARTAGRGPNRELEAGAAELKDAFLGEGDRGFRQVALSLISNNGALTAPPYEFEDDEFITD